jgi:hypothetical protein
MHQLMQRLGPPLFEKNKNKKELCNIWRNLETSHDLHVLTFRSLQIMKALVPYLMSLINIVTLCDVSYRVCFLTPPLSTFQLINCIIKGTLTSYSTC